MNPENNLDTAIAILKQKQESIQNRQDAIVEVLKHFTSEHFDLFEGLLADEEEEPQIRMMVALSLGKLGTSDCIEILQKHLTHPDPLLRSYVVQSLAMTDDEQTIPLIIEALKDSNNTVFASASECLSRFGKKAVPYLITLLKDGQDDARCVAAWNLGEIGASQCVPDLVEVVLSEKNEEVVALSVWALGRIGTYSTEVIESLQKATQQEAPEIRLRAEVALKKIQRELN